MTDRRVNHEFRKRVSEMSPDEMRRALLFSQKTGLPNRRAFDESEPAAHIAICDANGLKSLNDTYSYEAGDILISRIAEALVEAGIEAFHNQGDEFICKGGSYAELNRKLNSALEMVRKPFAVRSVDDRVTEVRADFCFGIGTDLKEAEKSLKHQKELLRALRGSQAK